jgi:hypothetical protein
LGWRNVAALPFSAGERRFLSNAVETKSCTMVGTIRENYQTDCFAV